MKPQEALDTLYSIVRQANLPADSHDKLKECYEVVKKEIEKNGNSPNNNTGR